MMGNNTFKVINNKGEEVICDVLFTFDSEETGKSYIVYTDNTRDESGNVQVLASIYDPTKESPKLEPIETEAEWQMIETILGQLQEDVKAKFMQAQKEQEEKEPKTLVVRLHTYAKRGIYMADSIYEKIGVVNVTATSGKFSIGGNMLNDVWLTDGTNVAAVEVMIGITNGELVISNCNGEYGNILNQNTMINMPHKNTFYRLHHGDEIILNNCYKFYVELFDKEELEFGTCSSCGKKFLTKTDGDEYCFDCRYEIEQELGMQHEKELEEVVLFDYLGAPQKSDIFMEVKSVDMKNPKIFRGLLG